jgi:hypothetical protein
VVVRKKEVTTVFLCEISEMFAFCESKTVKYKHCILSLYIFSGIGSLITKTFLCHKSKK